MLANRRIGHAGSTSRCGGRQFDSAFVRTSGQGVASEIEARLFEPFVNTKGPDHRPGVGLSLAHALLTDSFIEHRGKKSCVRGAILLPLPISRLQNNDSAGSMTRILLVEDDIDVRNELSNALKLFGYDVVEAKDAIHGLALMKIYEIGIVIADYRLPRVDGLEMTRSIRARPEWNSIPVIMISAVAGILSHSTRNGPTITILKPLDIDILHHTIERLLAIYGGGR